MRYVFAVAAVLAAVLALPAGGAAATHECDGLDVCIRARGPWVAVPAARAGKLQTVYYRMTCPRRAVVGGLDAVLGNRSLDVTFLGRMGSPVNPGITTERNAVFVASYAGRRPTAFQPLIGCIPRSGGGGGSGTFFRGPGNGTTFFTPALSPQPPVRRVRTLALPAGGARSVVVRCAAGERLAASSYAVGYRTRRLPSAQILAGATAVLQERDRSVRVRAQRGIVVPRAVKVEVQVHAICARSAP